MRDVEVAQHLRDEVDSKGPNARTSWRKATTLLEIYGISRLTPGARERIARSLDVVGLVPEPPIAELSRTGTVRLRTQERLLRLAEPVVPAEFRAVELTVTATEDSASRNVRWFDIDSAQLETGEGRARLVSACPGLTEEALKDAAIPDDAPGVKNYGDDVRVVSAIASFADDGADLPDGHDHTGDTSTAGDVLVQPVELVVGPGWLVSVWQQASLYRGAEEIQSDLPVRGRQDLVDDVTSAWRRRPGRTAGDAGLVVLEKLTVTHAVTRRALASWQELWEKSFTSSHSQHLHESLTLEELSGLIGLLIAKISAFADPYNKDYRGGWFSSATDQLRATRVDDLAESALRDLDRRRDEVRSASERVASALAAQQARASADLRHGIELVAALLLVPGLVAAVFGANVRLPGEGSWLGLAGLLLAMAASAAVTWLMMRWFRRSASGS